MAQFETTQKRPDGSTRDTALLGHPFARVRYHHGMLLEAPDFQVEQRAMMLRRRLHDAMLHGWGVVQGMRVGIPKQRDRRPSTELTVHPGLAVDPAGRSIFVPEDRCLNVATLHESDFWWDLDWDDDSDVRTAYVVLRYDTHPGRLKTGIEPGCSASPTNLDATRMYEGFRIALEAERPECGLQAADAEPWEQESNGAEVGDDRFDEHLRDVLVRNSLSPAASVAELWEDDLEAPLLLAEVTLWKRTREDAEEATVVPVGVDNEVRAVLPRFQDFVEEVVGHDLGSREELHESFKVASAEAAFESDELDDELVPTIRVTLTSEEIVESTIREGVDILFLEKGACGGQSQGWKRLSGPFSEQKARNEESDVGRHCRFVWTSGDGRAELRLECHSVDWGPDTMVQLCLFGDEPKPLIDGSGRVFGGAVTDPTPEPGRGRNFNRVFEWGDFFDGPSEDEPHEREPGGRRGS